MNNFYFSKKKKNLKAYKISLIKPCGLLRDVTQRFWKRIYLKKISDSQHLRLYVVFKR